MAQIALGVVGGVVGFVVGGPVGMSIGFTLGAAVGGAVDQAMADPIQGPRLSDLPVSTSTYGVAIPRLLAGSVRLPGNMVWSSGLIEHKKKSGKGFGAGKGPNSINYSYSAKWAMAFCAGPAGGLLRLWADGRLIYDATGTDEATQVSGFTVRWHTGSEDQLPNPVIVDALGEDRAPAYRGLAYALIEADLASFGNRIPAITAEIAAAASSSATPYHFALLGAAGGVYASPSFAGGLAVDLERGLILRPLGGEGATPAGVSVSSLYERRELRQASTATMLQRGGIVAEEYTLRCLRVAPGGPGFFINGAGRPYEVVYKFDPESLAVTGTFGAYVISAADRADLVPFVWDMATVRVQTAAGVLYFVVAAAWGGRIRIIAADTMQYVFGADYAADGAYIGQALPFRWLVSGLYGVNNRLMPGEERAEESDCWIFNGWDWGRGAPDGGGTTWDVWRLSISGTSADAVGAALVATLTGAMFGFASDLFSIDTVIFDATDGGALLHLRDCTTGVSGASDWLAKWTLAAGVEWCVASPGAPNPGYQAPGQGRVTAPVYAWGAGSIWTMIDTRSGEVLFSYQSVGLFQAGGQVWDSQSRSIIYELGDFAFTRFYLGQVSAEPSALAAVVGSLCDGAGLAADEYDTAGLTGTVRGMAAGQQTTRETLAQLASAYHFDAIESDDALRFRHRGGAVAATIPFDSLVRPDRDSPVLPDARGQELEIPRRVTVLYRDAARDQQSGAVSWQRAASPVPVVASQGEANLDLGGLVLVAEEARAVARQSLLERWVGRQVWDGVRLGPEYLALEPADPIMLELSGGGMVRARLDRVELGADYTLRIVAVAEAAAVYTLTAPGAGGAVPPQTVPGPYISRLLLGNLPLLRDMDDTSGAGLRTYAGAGAYDGQGWRGADLYLSRELETWDAAARLTASVPWGTALAALPPPASAHTWDRANVLRVSMASGAETIETATRLQVLNGANAAALLTPAGVAEILQFSTATVGAGGVLELSDLLRGRRGTEDACAAHVAGGLFLMLDREALASLSLPLSDLGGVRYWRLRSNTDVFDALTPQPRVMVGRAEQPYAPTRLRGSRDGSGNLALSWLRRTRLGGAWRNLTGTVPLGEKAESYELEILNGAGAVVRLISGLSAPAASYTAAQQTTDFGAPQAAVAVRVYQMSEAVGRGVPRAGTV